ncbi:hypothetical protein GOP47_0013306 [Adiantum capillus-veneris]|uniref:Membrane insertase YidC/Oxa/ALB C-terminal domain-containing protein n=1 Tax=Adiantum capillus-veneris TaxID=13818 RepID=A0A9D4UN86_ADICA|nr:hypothetical protein GOP47_0013306 [Adiantum capillus-veneris]
MAGARQLLRELLRERRASFSTSSHLSRPLADSSRGTSEAAFFSKVLPGTFSRDSCRSFTNSPVGSSALGTLSQIRAVGIPRHICGNGHGPALVGRYSSTVSGSQLEDELGRLGENAQGLDVATADVAEKLASPEAQAISEVSAIIGDCSYPTAFVQILMESVHIHLGLPWWGAIAFTTIAIRLLCLPIVAYQLKATAKLTLMRPKLEKINERIKASNYDPAVSVEGRQEIMALFKEHKTFPLAPFIGAVAQAPVFLSFFFAITNMCQRLESFKHGGLLFFTDLSAKDTTYILPLTLTTAMLIAVELSALEGMDGNPYAKNMKNFLRVFSVIMFPVSFNFETGLFFYWIPSNLFSIFQAHLFKQKAVKHLVGIPDTEHLAVSSTVASPAEPAVAPVAPALPDTRTRNSGKKKLAFGRNKSKEAQIEQLQHVAAYADTADEDKMVTREN